MSCGCASKMKYIIKKYRQLVIHSLLWFLWVFMPKIKVYIYKFKKFATLLFKEFLNILMRWWNKILLWQRISVWIEGGAYPLFTIVVMSSSYTRETRVVEHLFRPHYDSSVSLSYKPTVVVVKSERKLFYHYLPHSTFYLHNSFQHIIYVTAPLNYRSVVTVQYTRINIIILLWYAFNGILSVPTIYNDKPQCKQKIIQRKQFIY